MEKHEKALDRFMEQISEFRERLAELQEFADEHMGYNPDDINWGHVGTAGWYLERITELTDCAYKRGEYAE
ncbi:MAG: hypothetical protein LBC82_09245 [Oscillospiraceae bacterium]|jgi:hypothetical protein|nr:hypothetical protein [Oscillospiraceae bacterium]